jgi:hypothetical protein
MSAAVTLLCWFIDGSNTMVGMAAGLSMLGDRPGRARGGHAGMQWTR